MDQGQAELILALAPRPADDDPVVIVSHTCGAPS